jgi:hypothetical protein
VRDYADEQKAIDEACALFPAEFGLRDARVRGKKFTIVRGSCYYDSGIRNGKPELTPGPILYVYIYWDNATLKGYGHPEVEEGGRWVSYAKGTVEELRKEIVPL